MSAAPPAEPENLVLRYLRRIDQRLDGVERKLDELTMRLSSVERELASMHGDIALCIIGSTTSIAGWAGSKPGSN